MQKLLPKINVYTATSTEGSAEIAQTPRNQQANKKHNLKTPRSGTLSKNSIHIVSDEHQQNVGHHHFRNHIEDLSNNVFKNLKHLSEHVDDIHRPFEKYYDNHGLKNKKEIQYTLNTNYEFYQEEAGRSQMQRAMTLTTPYLTYTGSSASSTTQRFFTKTSSHKFRGTKLLDAPLIPEPKKIEKVSSNPRKLEVKARLKLELEANFERKFSIPTTVPVSNRTMTTMLDTDRRSPRDQNLTSKPQTTESNNPENQNTSNMSLMVSRMKRKEILNEIANKNAVNYDKIQSLLQRNDSYDDNLSTRLLTNTSPKNETTLKKKEPQSKKFDNVTYQILALGSKQRQKVKERLKSVLPLSTKYKEYFLKP